MYDKELIHIKASSASKISTRKNNCFSMLAGPSFGCPGATQACLNCYAMKGNHNWPNVKISLANNWLLIKNMERNRANKKIVNQLVDIIPKDAKMFRIHESSDFYSQWYLDAWTNVVKRRKDVLFWAYTRSFNLNFQKIIRQKNFTLFASCDKYNKDIVKKFISRYKNSKIKIAYGPVEKEEKIPHNSFICPATSGKLNIAGACEKCKLCVSKYNTNKNVVFIRH
jgi:hypothetical protein